jgi:hypothetical protein
VLSLTPSLFGVTILSAFDRADANEHADEVALLQSNVNFVHSNVGRSADRHGGT